MYFAILPLFALTNADVAFIQVPAGDILSSPIFLGVFFGLVIGKPAGIMLMSFIIVKTRLSTLPENVNWSHMLGAALLGGVGFTMSIFVANLAFADAAYVMVAKVAILAASLVAGVLGFAFLFFQAKAATRRGQRFEMELPSANNRQSHAARLRDVISESSFKTRMNSHIPLSWRYEAHLHISLRCSMRVCYHCKS